VSTGILFLLHSPHSNVPEVHSLYISVVWSVVWRIPATLKNEQICGCPPLLLCSFISAYPPEKLFRSLLSTSFCLSSKRMRDFGFLTLILCPGPVRLWTSSLYEKVGKEKYRLHRLHKSSREAFCD
jgi:hypothetical protein